jgi:hypothetical protein
MRPTTSETGVVAVKQPPLLLKLAAVASAIVLIGGFVSYRAGAFNWLAPPPVAPVEPVTPIEPPSQGYLPATEQRFAPPTLLPGSKSITIGDHIYVLPPFEQPAAPKSTATTPPSGSQP